tara:strand:- start:160 stop:453 length:294 start_codon:yes stop_codon:yes gene_type:complete
MNSELPPKELLEVRGKIDKIDKDLVELLEERFQLTYQVGCLKANQSLSSLDESREAQKLAEVRLWCEEKSLNPDLVVKLFRCIMDEVVKNHENLRNQ